jgi:uncharacterized protein YciI
MSLFVLTCLDKPDSLSLRMANREAHLAFIAAHRRMIRLAGPFVDAEGAMNGSMLIIEADGLAAVEALATQDPYAIAGLFQQTQIRAWKNTVGSMA